MSNQNQNESPIEHIKAQLDGRWESVLGHFGLAQQISAAPKNVHTPCPKTGDGKTKFRRFRDVDDRGGCYHNDYGPMHDGIAVIAWLNDWTVKETVKQLLDYVGGMPTEKVQGRRLVKASSSYSLSDEDKEKRQAVLRKVYAGSTPIEGTPAESYLRFRAIAGNLNDLSVLRYHPRLMYMQPGMDKPTYHPGMLAIYHDENGKPLTMHRTFLAPEGKGKAEVDAPKKIFSSPGDIRGGCIRLDEPIADQDGNLVIGICEGLENALSIREGSGCPMWVGYSDRVMTMVKFDPRIKTVVIWRDIDRSGAGKRAADDLSERLNKEGVRPIIMTPPSDLDEVDWNDIYVERGIAGMPKMPEGMRISAFLGGE